MSVASRGVLRPIHLVALVLSLSAGASFAQPRGGQPPAEALAACKSAKQGDACSFTGDRGKASGSCEAPEGKPLACRPSDAPTPGGSTSPAPK